MSSGRVSTPGCDRRKGEPGVPGKGPSGLQGAQGTGWRSSENAVPARLALQGLAGNRHRSPVLGPRSPPPWELWQLLALPPWPGEPPAGPPAGRWGEGGERSPGEVSHVPGSALNKQLSSPVHTDVQKSPLYGDPPARGGRTCLLHSVSALARPVFPTLLQCVC